MKTVINMDTYPRKAHFDYFRTMAYPYVGVTANVDVTAFLPAVKAAKQSFFLATLYSVMGAANAIPAFRQRIEGDGIVEYDYSTASCVILKEDESYAYCTLDGRMPLGDFLTLSAQKIDETKRGGGLEENEEVVSQLFISCLPWLNYTSLIQALPSPADSNLRISWGQYVEENGKITLPLTVLGHHALIDGLHIARFYQELSQRLADYSTK